MPSSAVAVRTPNGVPFDLEAIELGKVFTGAPVFSAVSFRIARGEVVALVGANGAGKSTLLHCLMGSIFASEGSARLLGTAVVNTSGQAMRKVRSQIGLVSQKHNLVPRMSVLSNVVHGLLGQRPGVRHWSQVLAPTTSREAAFQALAKVGLTPLARRRADRLSGGQSQRVAIARALVGAPKVLIADEPCASLDPAAGEDVMDLFFRLAREEGVTVVFTSHNVDHALRYGDRVLGLSGGRLEMDAAASALRPKDLHGLYA